MHLVCTLLIRFVFKTNHQMGPNPVLQTLFFFSASTNSSEQLLHKHLCSPSPSSGKSCSFRARMSPWSTAQSMHELARKTGFRKIGFFRVGFLAERIFTDFYFRAAGFCRGFCRRTFSPRFCGEQKVPRKILQENPRQNPPKSIQQKSPTHFCRGAGPRFGPPWNQRNPFLPTPCGNPG